MSGSFPLVGLVDQPVQALPLFRCEAGAVVREARADRLRDRPVKKSLDNLPHVATAGAGAGGFGAISEAPALLASLDQALLIENAQEGAYRHRGGRIGKALLDAVHRQLALGVEEVHDLGFSAA